MANLLSQARDRFVGAIVGGGLGGDHLTGIIEALDQERAFSAESRTHEGLADLELAQDDLGWRSLSGSQGLQAFTNRAALRKMVEISRVMYILNPLIRRAVTVQELYVWGSGCTIKADSPEVQAALDAFFKDVANSKVIGQGEEGWIEREREQRIDGNTFFVFFANKRTGAVRVRILPYDLVEDVIRNPQDTKEVWFYTRTSTGDGASSASGPTMLYPDINYNPPTKPATYGPGRLPIDWSVRVLHLKTGGLSSMTFGLPELYAGLNWATAYKKILENFATILNAYARLAMKMTGLPGKRGVAAAKSKMGTAINAGNFSDTNPPTNTASWMMMSGNVDVQPIKTAHSTTAPDEARALRSMVASAADLPEHFFGDSDVGNFATSETLDRPTELKMIARQNMWRQVIVRMAQFVMEASAFATQGDLRAAGYTGALAKDPFAGRDLRVVITPPEGKNLHVHVEFPNITERAVADRVRAVVNAATLNGRKAEGIIPDRKLLFKLLMDALGVQDVDELVAQQYPASIVQGFIDPADEAENHRMEAEATKLTAERPVAPPTPPKSVTVTPEK